MKIRIKARDNKIYSGEEIAQYMKDITPLEENKPTLFASIAKKYNFKLVKIPMNELIPKYINNDVGAMEYIEGMNRRYYGSNFNGWYTDNDEPVDIKEEDLNNPIVIVGGELLDGYSRVVEHIRRNKSYISAYVNIKE